MGSRYLFICLYLWLEKHLSRGDYKRPVEDHELESSDIAIDAPTTLQV
jgi:dolichol-phosphate mannosyltransferase